MDIARPAHASFDLAGHVERIHRDGYTIVEGVLDEGGLSAFRTGVAPQLGRWRGRNPFEGQSTERV